MPRDGSDDPGERRFRMTLAELERRTRIPLDQLVESEPASELEPTQTPEQRHRRDLTAGGGPV